MFDVLHIIAQQAQPTAAQQLMSMLVPIGLVVMVFWLLIWRPQRQAAQKHESYLDTLKKDDLVVTKSGIYGKVVSVDGKVITLEIGKDTKIKILRSAIHGPQEA